MSNLDEILHEWHKSPCCSFMTLMVNSSCNFFPFLHSIIHQMFNLINPTIWLRLQLDEDVIFLFLLRRLIPSTTNVVFYGFFFIFVPANSIINDIPFTYVLFLCFTYIRNCFCLFTFDLTIDELFW